MNSHKKASTGMNRREFLKATSLAGGGLMLSFTVPAYVTAADQPATAVSSGELNAFVKISSDGTITIFASNPEMGQGVSTALPMVIAEEMGAKWEDVVVEVAPIDSARFGRQSAGGSTTVMRNFNRMRQMGASAREMLIGAAAESMERPREELKARNSEIIHVSGDKMTFGQLAVLAAKQPVPDLDDLTFKDADDYTIIGTSVASVDNMLIATGVASFGIDAVEPDMLYAAFYKCPAIGGKAVSANLAEIKRLPGVTDAFIVDGNGKVTELLSGVAIVGDSTWAVFNARQHLKVNWNEDGASTDSWTELVATAGQLRQNTGKDVITQKGDVDGEFANDLNKVVEAHYAYPFVAHICMEPMNATASYIAGKNGEKDRIELAVPTQAPQRIPRLLNSLFGVQEDRVVVHQTRLGGGFGRRAIQEYACEAAEVSRRVGKPIKLTWTREDDVQHDFYRVGGFQNVKAALNKKGQLVAWDQHFIGMTRSGRAVSGSRFGATEFPLLNLGNARAAKTMIDIGTLCGPWRAPGSNTHAFVVQSFIHELAIAAGRDHLEFLLEITGEPRWFNPGNVRSLNTGRAADVIRLAAREAGWGQQLAEGSGLGLAFHFSHAAHIAEVAEVSVDRNRKLVLRRVTVAVDIGPIINMSGATTQVQGAVIDGYSTMVGQKITMEKGRIQQSNFNDYPVLRIPNAPEVDVHFIQSDNRPTGIGEPALPPLAPAVGNAIFAATGHRVRSMPLTDEGFTV